MRFFNNLILETTNKQPKQTDVRKTLTFYRMASASMKI